MNFKSPPNEARRLRRLHALGVIDSPPARVFEKLTQLAARVADLPVAAVSFLDSETEWFKTVVGATHIQEVPRQISFGARAISGDSWFEVHDAASDPRFVANQLVCGALAVRHYAGLPLTLPSGDRVGVVCVMSPAPGVLSPETRGALEDVAESIVEVLLMLENESFARTRQKLEAARDWWDLYPLGMFAADEHGSVLHANKQWATKLGLKASSEGERWNWTRRIHEADRDGVLDSWIRAVRKSSNFDKIFRVTQSNGEVAWLRMRAEPVAYSHSERQYVGILADVTERQLLIEQLQASEQLREMIFQSMPDGLAVFDDKLRLVLSNGRQRELLNLPASICSGPDASLESIMTYLAHRGEYGPGNPDEIVERRLAAMARPGRFDFENHRPNGTVTVTHVNHAPNGWRIHVFSDVTQTKKAEIEVRDQRQQLELALESSGLGMWEFHPLERTLSLSDGWAKLFGFAQGIDAEVSDLTSLVPPHAGEALQSGMVSLLKDEVRRMVVEYEQVNASGDLLWVRNEAKVVQRDSAGRATRVIGTVRDITDLRKVEQELKRAAAAAEQASQAKSDFLATMSHEIRTPINGVIGLARMLSSQAMPAEQAWHVGLIDSCAKTLLGLVDNILDFSKIEAGQMNLEQVDTQLRTLLRETCEIFDLRANEKGVHFRFEIASDLPDVVVIDPLRLRQILLNLLGNALKFTSKGEIALKVWRTEASDAAPMMHLAVSDTGIGMTEDQVSQIFQRFVQAEASTSRRYAGTGLGLAISRELSRLLGGDVEVASEPGRGSTFTLSLPVTEGRMSRTLPNGVPERTAAADARLLVAEDDPINQMVAEAVLQELGFVNITLVENGRVALDKCMNGEFDLVLMDCQMPEIGGLEATRLLRERGFSAPIVALTASATADDRQACLDAGMDDYLSKPMEPASLAHVLNRWLAKVSARSLS